MNTEVEKFSDYLIEWIVSMGKWYWNKFTVKKGR